MAKAAELVKEGVEERLDRLEAKLDQVLADGKAHQTVLGDIHAWLKRMVRVVKAQ